MMIYDDNINVIWRCWTM